MTTFSESNVNSYLNSISTNLIELQSFADDIESNFVNCFQTRFIMTQADIDNMNSWPTFLKDQIALATRFTVDYYATDTSIDLDFEIEGFEAPTVAKEANANAPAAAGDLKLNFRGSLDYNQSTGTIKYKAKVKLKYYIC